MSLLYSWAEDDGRARHTTHGARLRLAPCRRGRELYLIQGAFPMFYHIRSPIQLLCVLLVWVGLSTPSAFAAAGGCRSDPIVWLSNGAKVTMVASSTASASTVKLITYTVHVPRGVRMTKVVYTGGVLKDKERVVVVADRSSGYQLAIVADLGSTRAQVTIDAAVNTIRRSLTGSSGSPIVFLFS